LKAPNASFHALDNRTQLEFSRLSPLRPADTEVKLDIGNKNLHQTHVSGELNKQVRHRLALGLIAMTIPDKPNSRSQKYQLTSAGRELLDTL
jgi:hypothetical protein